MSGFQTLITQLLCFIADGYKETTANKPGKGAHKKYCILRGTRPLRGVPPLLMLMQSQIKINAKHVLKQKNIFTLFCKDIR